MAGWIPPDEVRDTLERIAADAAETARAPSLRVALFEGGEVRWEHAVGAAARQYRIGSITKTFTAVLVLRLRDEGLIGLNDRIGRHLDDTPYAEATIRDLLSHRSGMTAEPTGPWWERTPGGTWVDLVAANANQVHVFEAGATYHYSNLGYGLLGQLVSRVRGKDWYDVVREELLEPLDLEETTYHPGQGAAVGTSRNPLTGELQGEPAQDTGAMAPAGQLWSTTADLARWGTLLAGGYPEVISVGSLREMRTAHSADVDDQHEGAYGLGLRLRWQSTRTLVGHTGSMPGFQAGLFIDPATAFGGVVLANSTTGIKSETLAVALVAASGFAADSGANPVGVEPGDDTVGELEGDWYWGNTRFTLMADLDGFELRSDTEGRSHMRRLSPDRFIGTDDYWSGETLEVVRHSDGSLSHLEVVTFILTRIPYDAKAPIPGGPPRPMP